MKKQIRLLVENLFDDEFNNIYNDTDLDTDITDEYMGYSVGDIVYENKKPYAICCGDKKDFKDKQQRFCLYKQYKYKLQWRNKNINKVIKQIEPGFYKLINSNDRQYIDENGYGNTIFIKNNFNISDFPVFKYCCKFGDNVYIPAIDELSVWYLNREKIKYINKSITWYWSSTSCSNCTVYGLNLIDSYISNFRTFDVMFVNLFVKIK